MMSELKVRIEDRYAGGAQVLVRVVDPRVDGAIWVVVGVRDQHLVEARSAGSWREYEDVWAPGDSRDCWCPPGVDPERALEFARRPALRAWLADDEAVR